MKFIKYFFIVLFSLTVVFLLIGVFFPKVEYENKVVINRPVNEVFGYFTNPNNLSKWMENLQRVEVVKGIPMTPGSQYKLVLMQNGDSVKVNEEVTSFKANEMFGFHLYNRIIDCNVTLTFVGKGTSTELTNHNVVEGKGIFFRSLIPVLRSSLKSSEQHIYERFKKVVEEGPMLSELF